MAAYTVLVGPLAYNGTSYQAGDTVEIPDGDLYLFGNNVEPATKTKSVKKATNKAVKNIKNK